MKIRTTMAALIAALYIPFATAKAEQPQAKGSVELMAGQDSATLDTKLVVPLADRLSLFNRNRITVNYDGSVNTFHVLNASYEVAEGLGLVAEADASRMGVVPRAGLQYGAKLGDVSVFALTTVALQDNPDVTMIFNAGYSPEISDDVRLVLGSEFVTSVNGDGHNFSTQRLRAGVSHKNLTVGAAADLTEVGNDGEVGYNAGGFAKIAF